MSASREEVSNAPASAAVTRTAGDPPKPRGVRRRSPRSTILVTGILVVVSLYFLVPIYWVVVAATKTTEDLFATNGFWFAPTIHLWENLTQVFTYDGGIFLR